MNDKKPVLLDASGQPASAQHIVVRSLKTYALVDLEVSTDAEGPLELLTNARDPFAATIVAVRMELDKRDAEIAYLRQQHAALVSRFDTLRVHLELVGKVMDSESQSYATAIDEISDKCERNRIGVDVAQRAVETLMVEAGKLQ